MRTLFSYHVLEEPVGLNVVIKEKIVAEDVQAIIAPLADFNQQTGPATTFKGIVITLQDSAGKIVGGLWGRCGYDWLHIEAIVIPQESLGQGLGRKLMDQAETIARENACVGIHLSTLAFQARGFYEKLGFTVFGQLKDFPAAGGTQFFMQKRLQPVASLAPWEAADPTPS